MAEQQDKQKRGKELLAEGVQLASAVVSLSDMKTICADKQEDEALVLFAGMFAHLLGCCMAEIGAGGAKGMLTYLNEIMPELMERAEADGYVSRRAPPTE